MPLNDRQIRNAKPTEAGKKAKLFDGGGLYLEVTPAGGKIFRLKYRIDGKEKTLTIGKYPAVSLSEARQAAENARRLLSDGQDPGAAKQQEKEERKAAALNTFESIARRWHSDNLRRWKENHAARVLRYLEAEVFPAIGAMQMPETERYIQALCKREAEKQAEAFMSVHAHGMRFSDWSDHHTNHEHAGYRKQAGEDTEYWINPPTFEIEICGSYDKAKVCEVLHAVGWLLKNEEKGRWQHQRRVGKARSYYFVLKNEAPPDTEE